MSLAALPKLFHLAPISFAKVFDTELFPLPMGPQNANMGFTLVRSGQTPVASGKLLEAVPTARGDGMLSIRKRGRFFTLHRGLISIVPWVSWAYRTR